MFTDIVQLLKNMCWRSQSASMVKKKAIILYIWKPSYDFESTTHCSFGNCFRIISFVFSLLLFLSFVYLCSILPLRSTSVRARNLCRRTCGLPIAVLINSRPLLWRSHYWKN